MPRRRRAARHPGSALRTSAVISYSSPRIGGCTPGTRCQRTRRRVARSTTASNVAFVARSYTMAKAWRGGSRPAGAASTSDFGGSWSATMTNRAAALVRWLSRIAATAASISSLLSGSSGWPSLSTAAPRTVAKARSSAVMHGASIAPATAPRALVAFPSMDRRPLDLRLDLRGRAALRRERDVGERRVGGGPVPVLLFRGNVHDVARGDDLLLRLRRDDALARGHEQDLIAAVGVHLVASARAEVDDAEIELVARLGGQQTLTRHVTTGEQGSLDGFSGDLVGLEH